MTLSADDRLAIMETVANYGWGYDASEFDLIGDTFTADGTSSGKVSGTDVAWGPMKGREEIVSVLKGIRENQAEQVRHCMVNFRFLKHSDTTANVRCVLNLIGALNGQSRSVSGGWYDIDVVKESDGVWRMSRMDCVMDAPF